METRLRGQRAQGEGFADTPDAQGCGRGGQARRGPAFPDPAWTLLPRLLS